MQEYALCGFPMPDTLQITAADLRQKERQITCRLNFLLTLRIAELFNTNL